MSIWEETAVVCLSITIYNVLRSLSWVWHFWGLVFSAAFQAWIMVMQWKTVIYCFGGHACVWLRDVSAGLQGLLSSCCSRDSWGEWVRGSFTTPQAFRQETSCQNRKIKLSRFQLGEYNFWYSVDIALYCKQQSLEFVFYFFKETSIKKVSVLIQLNHLVKFYTSFLHAFCFLTFWCGWDIKETKWPNYRIRFFL